MKNYTITVNGNVYDVTVEEKGAGAPAPGTCSSTRSSTCCKGSTKGSTCRQQEPSSKSRSSRKSIPDFRGKL